MASPSWRRDSQIVAWYLSTSSSCSVWLENGVQGFYEDVMNNLWVCRSIFRRTQNFRFAWIFSPYANVPCEATKSFSVGILRREQHLKDHECIMTEEYDLYSSEKIGEKTGEKMALMKINVVPEECSGKRAVEPTTVGIKFTWQLPRWTVEERYSIVFRNNEINVVSKASRQTKPKFDMSHLWWAFCVSFVVFQPVFFNREKRDKHKPHSILDFTNTKSTTPH